MFIVEFSLVGCSLKVSNTAKSLVIPVFRETYANGCWTLDDDPMESVLVARSDHEISNYNAPFFVVWKNLVRVSKFSDEWIKLRIHNQNWPDPWDFCNFCLHDSPFVRQPIGQDNTLMEWNNWEYCHKLEHECTFSDPRDVRQPSSHFNAQGSFTLKD